MSTGAGDARVDVAVPRFPAIGEAQELDALAADGGARVRFVEDASSFGDPDLVVLPGSEATLADLAWLRATGLDAATLGASARGAVVVGICGGLQIMGARLHDPERREGGAAEDRGLALLPVDTIFLRDEVHEPSIGTSSGALLPPGARVRGREIHGGRSTLRGEAVRLFDEDAKGGGACPLGLATAGLGAMATYLHDVFEDDAFRAAVLRRARERRRLPQP